MDSSYSYLTEEFEKTELYRISKTMISNAVCAGEPYFVHEAFAKYGMLVREKAALLASEIARDMGAEAVAIVELRNRIKAMKLP